MSYQQTLYKIIEPIKRTTIHRLNKKNTGNTDITKNTI
jgi:hypothetical protein